jgi:hypothetical protein
MDEIMQCCVKDDWISSAQYEAQNMDAAQLKEALEYADCESIEDLTCEEKAREFCDFAHIEPETIEALQHWLVSDWLADKLEAQGEMVLHDFLGFNIWGRACCGQALSADSVFNEIAKSIGE